MLKVYFLFILVVVLLEVASVTSHNCEDVGSNKRIFLRKFSVIFKFFLVAYNYL